MLAKDVLANIMLFSNVFIWYLCIFLILRSIISGLNTDFLSTLTIWGVNFVGAVLSALIGAALIDKIGKRKSFFILWILLGIFSTLMLMLIDATVPNMLMLSSFLGVSFGLGVPACMGFFAESTTVENRARFGGIIMFINFAGAFLLLGAIASSGILMSSVILAMWRGLGLISLLLINEEKDIVKETRCYYLSIISQKSFLYYFIPWLMFSLVNFFGMQIQTKTLGEKLAELLIFTGTVISGIFAIISGFLSDFFGRKRMAITGFVILGLGYAILGIFPKDLFGWFFYTLVDGAAWGIFYTLFFMTIWGDLAYGTSSAKYYALGGLPYLLSNFLRISIGVYVSEAVPDYAIFSFSAFFLFLAVIPLMYAPETLPEKTIRDRELKQYIEKAKKAKEKYT